MGKYLMLIIRDKVYAANVVIDRGIAIKGVG